MPFSRYLTQKELEATVEEIMMEPNSDQSGYHTLPRIQHYWSTEEDKGIDLVKRCMSRNRFQSIKQNLHLSDNSILDKNVKISKVRPFSDVITKKIYSLMNKWYITLAASKPVRFRFKLWCLCSSDGYLFYSTPYGVAQNQTHSNLGLGGDVVLS
nr:unnamed protein product [Callosobruchus chinensis]